DHQPLCLSAHLRGDAQISDADAFTKDQGIVTGIVIERIRTVAAEKIKGVISRSAVQIVIVGAADQIVITAVSKEKVIPGPAIEIVGAVLGKGGRAGISKGLIPIKLVVADPTQQCVITPKTVELIVTVFSID